MAEGTIHRKMAAHTNDGRKIIAGYGWHLIELWPYATLCVFVNLSLSTSFPWFLVQSMQHISGHAGLLDERAIFFKAQQESTITNHNQFTFSLARKPLLRAAKHLQYNTSKGYCMTVSWVLCSVRESRLVCYTPCPPSMYRQILSLIQHSQHAVERTGLDYWNHDAIEND